MYGNVGTFRADLAARPGTVFGGRVGLAPDRRPGAPASPLALVPGDCGAHTSGRRGGRTTERKAPTSWKRPDGRGRPPSPIPAGANCIVTESGAASTLRIVRFIGCRPSRRRSRLAVRPGRPGGRPDCRASPPVPPDPWPTGLLSLGQVRQALRRCSGQAVSSRLEPFLRPARRPGRQRAFRARFPRFGYGNWYKRACRRL
jgi:hypothetical protein